MNENKEAAERGKKEFIARDTKTGRKQNKKKARSPLRGAPVKAG